MVETALRDLAERWQRYWPDVDAAELAADVRSRLAGACAAWQLGDPQPLAGGVVALTCATGGSVVKVLPRMHPEENEMRAEAEALRAWRGCPAAVELRGERDGGLTLLLERVRPGTTLDAAGTSYDDQLAIVGSIVRALHAAVDPPIAHGDLHGGNVLAGPHGWVAIDPKGTERDPLADVWLLVCPQAPPLPDDPESARAEARRRATVYAAAAGLDPDATAASAGAIAAREAELCADSAFTGWPQRLRRLAAALS